MSSSTSSSRSWATSTSRRRRGSDIVTPRRVLEVRDRVDELRPPALGVEAVERRLELVDAHAVVVHRDLHDVGLVGHERRDRAGVGRRLGDDHVAGVDQRLADEVDDLLAAGRDEHVLGVDRRVLGGHHLGDARPWRRPCPRSARTGARGRRPSAAIFAVSAASDSAGNVEVSGSPPASEMTSGRSVIAMRSRIAEDFMTFVRDAKSAGVALEVAGRAARGRGTGIRGPGRAVACRLQSSALHATGPLSHEAHPRHPPGHGPGLGRRHPAVPARPRRRRVRERRRRHRLRRTPRSPSSSRRCSCSRWRSRWSSRSCCARGSTRRRASRR